MIEMDTTSCQKIHTRNIQVASYVCEENAIIVEGRLQDDRLMDSYRLDGEVVPAGVVHHLIIRMRVQGPRLEINDIEVEMPTAPIEACLEMSRSLEPVKGLPIISGFTIKAKELVGGAKGCAHLVALLMAMAPAAVQGAWSAATRRPNASNNLMAHSLERMKDTCFVWRSDGPAFKNLEQTLKR
jgi:DUF2889 family protein